MNLFSFGTLHQSCLFSDNYISDPLSVSTRRHKIPLILIGEHIDWSRVDASTFPALNLQKKLMRQPNADLDQKCEYAVNGSVKQTRLHELYCRLCHIDRGTHAPRIENH